MSRNGNEALDRTNQEREGFFRSLYADLRLIARLLKDPRVNFLLKLLPIGALIYLISPLDIAPVNPLDDGLVLWLGGYFFIELCPPDVVEEHRSALRKQISEDSENENPSTEVVDGTFREVQDDKNP